GGPWRFMANSEEISASEEEVYDRQLRLWGRNAQSRLKSGSVLIFGLSAINVEVAKNVLLAGANITLADDRAVTEDARAWNFLLPADLSAYKTLAEASAASLREMNPLAAVTVTDEKSVDMKKFNTASIDLEFNFPEAKRLAEAARRAGVAVFLSFGFGGVGWWCADLVKHRVLERSLGNKAAVEITTASFDDLLSRPMVDLLGGVKLKKAPFECAMVPLLLRIRSQLGSWPASEKEFGEQLRSVTASSTDAAMAKFLEPISSEPRLLQHISAGPIPPCAAVVGGLLGQEVVKVVTRRDEPLVNTVTYSCRTNGAHVEKMPAKGANEVTAVKERHATGAENAESSALVATVLEEDEDEGEEPMELD
ncbi:SUMO-activating enzyme subunit 1, partial [Perkinsus olseni]